MTDPDTAPAPQPARRTSPRILLVHAVTFRQARQFVPVLIPVVAATGFGGGRTTMILLAVAVTLFSLLTAALSWWRFSYSDGPGSVVVTRGLLTRSVRTVPTDRVRGVDIETPLLHRLFGLVRVRIDAAAGGGSGTEEELLIDGVPRAEADRLRTAVLRARPGTAPAAGTDGPAEEAPREETFGRFDNRWLLYAPLVGSYLAVPVAAVGAGFRLWEELGRSIQPDIDGLDLGTGPGLSLTVAGTLLVLLAAGAVVGAVLVNWGFTLVRRGGSLIAVRGLVTRRHTELEIDRIRGCTVSEGLGMRWVGAARVSALVTGLGDAARRGQLLPLGPRGEAWALARRLVDDPGPLTRHPPAARRRRIGRAVAAGVLVSTAGIGAGIWTGRWGLLVAGIVLTALGLALGLGRYASLGHVAGPRSFAVRSGWLVREQAVLQRRAVVGWRVRQSFFQRRAGLATVVACVGAGTGGYRAVDLAAADVVGFTGAASEPWAATLSAETA